MKLEAAQHSHLPELMRWFPDQQSCAMWGGPEFRFPFTLDTFREDLRLHLPSYSVVGDTGEFLGFGQYYVRVGRCHLARLAISPPHRGRALGEFLIRELCRIGCRELNAKDCSLFVMESNAPALKLYRRLGFVDAQYPGDMPSLAGVIYMVVPFEALVTEQR
jgi:ribosomal protein S18 acetylase RimI-like enzyme